MSNIISTVNNAEVVADAGNSMASQIIAMSSSPDFDVSKLEKLMDLQEREANRQAKMAFNQAFAEMQNEIPVIAKSKQGNGSKYATLEDVVEVTRPILNKYGFATYFDTKTIIGEKREAKGGVVVDGMVEVTANLVHTQGHSTSTALVIPFDFSGSKNSNTAQAMGSAVSYGKRYALCALLNIATRDDDDAQTSTVNRYKTVTECQAKLLVGKFDKLNEDKQKGCKKWLMENYGVDDFYQVPLLAFQNVSNAIERSINSMGKEAEPA